MSNSICILVSVFFSSFFYQKTDIPFTFKQTKIILNNLKGVPFTKDENGGYYIEGFEIDTNGDFFFLGGDQAVIARYAGNKCIYRKSYKQLVPGQLSIQKNELVFFEFKFNRNSIAFLNKENGNLIKVNKLALNLNINSYNFLDSTLAFSCINKDAKSDTYEYDYYRGSLKKIEELYYLPISLQNEDGGEFIGKWNDNYVFLEYSDKSTLAVTLKDKKNNTKGRYYINEINLGKPIHGDSYAPSECVKLRNGILYLLYRQKEFATVTEIPLNSIFSNK